ncbi:MAG: glycosyltransferase family 4 protein, partial [Pseudomonadota bacterium]
DPSTLLYDQPAAEITRVRLNQLTDRMIVEGWYRAYEPVTSLELRVFGDECYAIPEITEDEELTRKLGFRGPRVFRFQYHTELSVALNDADRLPSADGQSATVELDLMSRRESLATFAAAPEVVERITSRASYIVFDKRKSVLMVWGQCAPGKPPKRVAFHVGGRQVGDSLVPVLPDADPTAKISTWFVAEEVNFELKAGQKIQLYVEAEDGALEQIGGLPEPVIVSARNVVETPSKDSVTKALHEHNATRTNLEEPTVCFAFQGSMTSVGGAVTRITNMMSAFKRAGYSVILLDRTAPWEFYEGLENYKALRRICDLHLTIPQFYKSDLLGLSTAAWEKRSDLSASEKTLLGYLRRSKKEGRLLKGADPLYNRVDSHFNYACAAVLHDLRPDVVITQFAWSCEMHTALPEGTFGFIDTHDVQSARYLNFKAAAETYGAAAVPELARFQVDRNVEQKFLSMADAAIAISPDEHEDLNDMIGSRRTVLATLSRQDGEPIGSPKDSRSVLFVGNNYAANNYGIRTFIEQMWVKVLAAVPDAQLNVIGTCCDSIDDLKETQNVTLHGRVDDLSDLYGEAAVVINPMYFGTGMAVKMVEALGAGKAVVSTPVGARGLEEAGRHGAVKIAETSAAFEADTIALLKDSKARAKLEKAASTYSQTYLAGDVVYSNLFNFIESRLFY